MKWILIFLTLAFSAYSQDYDIELIFENGEGKLDSVTVGYAEGASYDIDVQHGEVNILGAAYDPDFEVRTAIYDYEDVRHEDTRIIESKKMIIDRICDDKNYFDEANAIMLVIKNNNWPIKVSWNKDRITEVCERSYLVNCTPGGWFDVCDGKGGEILTSMHLTDSISFDETSHTIVEESGDTLRTLFIGFYNRFKTSVSEDQIERVYTIRPNPSQSIFKFNNIGRNGDEVDIYSSNGTRVVSTQVNKEINLQGRAGGAYYYVIRRDGGIVQTGVLLKK